MTLGPLTEDAFLGGRIRLRQPRTGYRAAMDPVLLAAAVAVAPGARVLDIGCGAGAAMLCLAARVPGLELHGLELQPAYGALARANAALNGIGACVHDGDLDHPPAALGALRFDAVLMNPPYYAASDPPAADPGRATALREGEAGVERWICAALRWLGPKGRLTLIHTAGRLPAILAALGTRVGDVAVLPLCPRAGRPAQRVIVAARAGSRAPFRLLAPLILHAAPAHAGDGEDLTEAARAVLRDGAALDLGPPRHRAPEPATT